MIDTFAWTAIETTDGGIDLALIAAGPARVPTPVAVAARAPDRARSPRPCPRSAGQQRHAVSVRGFRCVPALWLW